MLRGRHGVGWMIAGWLAIVASLGLGFWIVTVGMAPPIGL